MRRGHFTSVPDWEDQLRTFFQYFHTTMARPFDWTYTGKPVTRSLRASDSAPHSRSRRRSNGELAKLSL